MVIFGQAVGSAIGGVLYAGGWLYGSGYVAAGFVALALATLMLTGPKDAPKPGKFKLAGETEAAPAGEGA